MCEPPTCRWTSGGHCNDGDVLMRKLLGVLALLVGMVAVGAAPASAGYASDNPDGAVLSSTVTAGQPVTFVADCFVPGTLVAVSVSGPGNANVTVAGGSSGRNDASGDADDDGGITAYAKSGRAGVDTITASGERTCASGDASADFTVVAAAGSGSDDSGSGGAGLVALTMSRRKASGGGTVTA